MADLQTCLKFAVGLSQRECPCFESGRPVDHDRSDSGYFIDSLDDGIPLAFPASVTDCGDGSIWDLLEQARIQGITEFHTGFLAGALRHADQSIVPSRGQIGDDKTNSGLYVTNPVCGIVIKPKTMRGAAMLLNAVHLTMNGTGPVEVKLYRSDNFSTALLTINFSALNNQKVTHTLANPLSLPFVSDTGEPYKYYFVYERTGGIQPRDKVFNCGCGSVVKNWDGYVDAKGFTLAALGDLNDGVTGYDGFTYGIQLDASFSCDAAKWMCVNQFDYNVDAYSRVIAKVIQLYTINKLIGYILNSPAINRFTVMPKEGIISRHTANQRQIESNMIWLGQNLAQYAGNMTDCFTCKADNIFNKQAILV